MVKFEKSKTQEARSGIFNKVVTNERFPPPVKKMQEKEKRNENENAPSRKDDDREAKVSDNSDAPYFQTNVNAHDSKPVRVGNFKI